MATHITGKCPHCESAYRLQAHAPGRRARCKTCLQVFVVPGKRLGASVEDDVAGWLNGSRDDDADSSGMEEDEDEEDDEAQAPPNTGLDSTDVSDLGARPSAS